MGSNILAAIMEQLLGILFLTHLNCGFGHPPSGNGHLSSRSSQDTCECINPWEGEKWRHHQGDPDNTCPTFCYVKCDSNCSDRKPAKGGGRCFSEEACPRFSQLFSSPETGIWSDWGSWS